MNTFHTTSYLFQVSIHISLPLLPLSLLFQFCSFQVIDQSAKTVSPCPWVWVDLDFHNFPLLMKLTTRCTSQSSAHGVGTMVPINHYLSGMAWETDSADVSVTKLKHCSPLLTDHRELPMTPLVDWGRDVASKHADADLYYTISNVQWNIAQSVLWFGGSGKHPIHDKHIAMSCNVLCPLDAHCLALSLAELGNEPEATFQMENHCWQKGARPVESSFVAQTRRSHLEEEITKSSLEYLPGGWTGFWTACVKICKSEQKC